MSVIERPRFRHLPPHLSRDLSNPKRYLRIQLNQKITSVKIQDFLTKIATLGHTGSVYVSEARDQLSFQLGTDGEMIDKIVHPALSFFGPQTIVTVHEGSPLNEK